MSNRSAESRNKVLQDRNGEKGENGSTRNSNRSNNHDPAKSYNSTTKSNLPRTKGKTSTAKKENSGSRKNKDSHFSNNQTVFERLANDETFTSADRRGKTGQTRKTKDRAKGYVPLSSIVNHTQEKIKDSAKKRDRMRRRRKEIQTSAPLSSLLAKPEYDCQFDVERNEYRISTPIQFTHCPEFEALSELNKRIKDNLSQSYMTRSNHSRSTVRQSNESGTSITSETSETDQEKIFEDGVENTNVTKNDDKTQHTLASTSTETNKTSDFSRGSTYPTTQKKRHPSFASSNTALFNRLSKHEMFATTNRRLSPELVAIDELNQRVKASLSITYFSQNDDSSELNGGHLSSRNDLQSSTIDEAEGEDDTADSNCDGLFNLIWERQFDLAKIYIHDINRTKNQIKNSLLYQNQDGWNALMRAFYRRRPKDTNVQDSLIQDMIHIGGKEVVIMTNIYGDNSLVCAIRNKHSTKTIKLLLQTGGGREYVLQKNFRGRTPLHWACEMNSSIEVVKCLVELGGKELVVMEDDNGKRAQSKSADVVNYLIEIGGDLKKKGFPKRSAKLHDFLESKMFDKMEVFLDDNDVNLDTKRSAIAYKDKNGWTQLMLSVVKDVPDSVVEKMILTGGSEILSMTNKWENIALLYALAHKRNLNIIKLFVENGGGKDCVAKSYGKGLTPLHWACKYNSTLEIIEFLIKEGAKKFPVEGRHQLLSMTCHCNQIPLHLTCANGPHASLDVVIHILDTCHKSVLEVKDKDLKLPVHIACERKASFDIIKHLIDNGKKESLLLSDADGKIPLHLACENGASLETVLHLAKVGGRETVNKVPHITRNRVHKGVLASSDIF